MFTDEWGGGTSPMCQANSMMEMGGNTILTIDPKKKYTQHAYYKINTAQTAEENCVSHNGGLIPETGRYLVESVALCWACHTQRSQMTGALTGPRFGGTTGFTEADDPNHTWSPQNITSDRETGRLGKLTEDKFVARFRQGRVIPGSPMPWQAFRAWPRTTCARFTATWRASLRSRTTWVRRWLTWPKGSVAAGGIGDATLA